MVRRPLNLPIFNKSGVLSLLKSFDKNKVTPNTHIFNKSLTILKGFLGLKIVVYKGNLFRKVYISKYLLGYKFGEFTHTRKPFNYPIVKKKKRI